MSYPQLVSPLLITTGLRNPISNSSVIDVRQTDRVSWIAIALFTLFMQGKIAPRPGSLYNFRS